MNDISQDSLLREIDEDLRRERYAKLWKRWGNFVVAGVLGMVLVVAGFQAWKYRVASAQRDAAARYTAALQLAERDRPAAEQALAALAKDAPSGYAVLAQLRQAALRQQAGDRQGARALYQDVQRGGEPMWRDLAVVLETQVALEAEALPLDADALAAKLKPLLTDANPWRYTARELSALLDWRAGRGVEARSGLTALASDAQVPADMRERAKQFLAQLGPS